MHWKICTAVAMYTETWALIISHLVAIITKTSLKSKHHSDCQKHQNCIFMVSIHTTPLVDVYLFKIFNIHSLKSSYRIRIHWERCWVYLEQVLLLCRHMGLCLKRNHARWRSNVRTRLRIIGIRFALRIERWFPFMDFRRRYHQPWR